jgi:shikimate dehydrogenase
LNGHSVGHNTDGFGFAEFFRWDMAGVKTDRVIQLGAGGAGKAVAHALLSCGVKHVALSVRNPEKVQPIVDFLGSKHGASRISIVGDLADEIGTADGVVNATPIGMDAYPGIPLATSFLRPDLWVVDLIYSPSETELLRSARAIGAKTSNGTGMFVYQAAEQFRLFSGTQPNVERMQAHIAQILASRKP